MYLSDYLFSIEYNNGDFTRKKIESAFTYGDKLEDRMISSLKVDDGGNIYFDFEHNRIITIIRKVSIGLLFLNCGNVKSVGDSNFILVTHLSLHQKQEYETIEWIVLQKGRFKYFISGTLVYFVINEILLCLSSYDK
jgi:hypothetical protein